MAGHGLVHANCRSPRRTGDAGPSRRCRRRTCRAGAARARGLPAPRCRRPYSCRSFGGLADGADHGFCFYLWRYCMRDGDRAALHQRQASLRRWRAFGSLPALVIGFAEQVAQGPETEGWHGFLSPRWCRWEAVCNARHKSARPGRISRTPPSGPGLHGIGGLASRLGQHRGGFRGSAETAAGNPALFFWAKLPMVRRHDRNREATAAGAGALAEGAFGAPRSARPSAWRRRWR